MAMARQGGSYVLEAPWKEGVYCSHSFFFFFNKSNRLNLYSAVGLIGFHQSPEFTMTCPTTEELQQAVAPWCSGRGPHEGG